ncbi:MAG: hypothetical protein HN405_10385, partial [Planctomycetes bacterium]|nr:hypothetical protein [Planctomycetota bacterium]
MRKNRNFNLFILVTSVFLALILLLSPTNIFDTNAAEYTQDLDLSSTQRKSLALDLIPTTATPSRSTLATVSSIEVVLLIRGSHDSVVSGHFEDGSGLQSVPFSQKQGQVSIPLRLPLSSFTLRLQDGWTASSYDVCANADPVYIELFPPRSLSFHFEQDGLSLSMAHVFLSSFESEVSIRGLTDQAGNATFPGISPSPLHVFLAHPDVLAKWSFPDGFGVSNRVVSLPIGDTFPHEVFTVADSVTHDPISMAHIEWSGQSIESFSSDSLGLLRFPPRTKNIDLIELSADGYGKQLVPLDDGGPTLYLQPEVDLTVQVVESQGLRQATGATVAAFLRTPNGMVHLSTKEADSKGHCRFSFHDGDDVALLAWRSHSGMATHELIVSRPMSEVRILLLKQKPLLIHLNGETAIGDLQVTTDS